MPQEKKPNPSIDADAAGRGRIAPVCSTLTFRPTMTLRNNMAAFVWGFAAVFAAFVAAMTYILIRDGTPQVYPPAIVAHYPPWFMLGLMSIFWLGAGGLISYAASKHCLWVRVQPDSSVLIIRRYPLRTESRLVERAEMSPAKVVTSLDDEGSPYFHARLLLADRTVVDIAEGHDRESCEETCKRFNGAVWMPSLPNGGAE